MTSLGTLSFQFFTPAGNSAMKVFMNFGAADPTPEQSAHFERLVQEFKSG
jgi:putative heme iron utilization protein